MQLVFNNANFDRMLCIDIPIIDDSICEDDETINVLLTTNDPDAVVTTPSTIATIVDNDGGFIITNNYEL